MGATTTSQDPAGPTLTFVLALIGIVIIGPLSLTIFLPALPAIQRDFRMESQAVQLTLSLPFIMIVVAPAIAGGLADRIGRRPVVLASLGVVLASSIAAALAPNLWVLIVARTVLGVSGTCAMVVGRAIVQDSYPAKDLTAAMARYAIAPVVVMMLAPLAGGFLTDGYGWRMVFYFLAAATVAILALTLVNLGETTARGKDGDAAGQEEEGAGKPAKTPIGHLFGSRAFWGYMGQSSLHFGVAVGFVATIPYIMENILNRSAADYGIGLLLIVLGLLAGVLLARPFARSVAGPLLVLIGSAMGAVAGIVLPGALMVLGWGLSVELLFGAAALVAVGIGFAMPASQAGIVGAVPALAGTASGLSSCTQMIMAAVFVHIAAVAWDDPALALGLIALAGMGIAALFALAPLGTKRAGE